MGSIRRWLVPVVLTVVATVTPAGTAKGREPQPPSASNGDEPTSGHEQVHSFDVVPEARSRFLAPLRAAGLDQSTEKLLLALSNPNPLIREGSILLLSERPPSPEIFNALKGSLSDEAVTVRLRASLALEHFGDDSWEPVSLRMLEADVRAKSELAAIGAAGLLAANGNPVGWEVVRKGLMSTILSEVQAASIEAPYFRELTMEVNKGGWIEKIEIDVVDQCAEAFKKGSAESQLFLLTPLSKTGRPDEVAWLRTLLPYAKSNSVRFFLEAAIRSAEGISG